MQPFDRTGMADAQKVAPNKTPNIQTKEVFNRQLAVGALPGSAAEAAHDSPECEIIAKIIPFNSDEATMITLLHAAAQGVTNTDQVRTIMFGGTGIW